MEEPEWDPWEICGPHCGGYSSETDSDLIAVFIETGKGGSWYETIADRLDLDRRYVMLLMEILCSGNFCEYGTSPRGAWAIHADYEANVAKLKDWYRQKWGEEWEPSN